MCCVCSSFKYSKPAKCWHVFLLSQGDSTYSLYAVVVHSGFAYYGHYTAFIKSPGGQEWYYADDSSVQRVRFSVEGRRYITIHNHVLMSLMQTGILCHKSLSRIFHLLQRTGNMGWCSEHFWRTNKVRKMKLWNIFHESVCMLNLSVAYLFLQIQDIFWHSVYAVVQKTVVQWGSRTFGMKDLTWSHSSQKVLWKHYGVPMKISQNQNRN